MAYRRTITLFLAIPTVIGAYLLGVAASPRPGSAPPLALVNGLAVASSDLDLGEVWESPEHVAHLDVRNTTDADIHVTDFQTSCECSSVEPRAVTVPALQSVQVTLQIDLTHRPLYLRGLSRRPARMSLTPVVAGAGGSASWEVTAAVRSRASLSSHYLQFDDRVRRGETATRKVSLTAHVPVERFETEVVPAHGTAAVVARPGQPGEYDLAVTPLPTLAVGPYRFAVRVVAVSAGGERWPCAALNVYGTMEPAARVVPSAVLLGEVTVGAEAEGEVTVVLPREPGWRVESGQTHSRDTVVAAAGDGDGGPRYRVAQTITAEGDQVRRVTFRLRHSSGQADAVETVVRFHGTEMELPPPRPATK